MSYKNILVTLTFLLIGAVTSYAQPKINSPFSRVGLGDLNNQNFGAINGMADVSSAYFDAFHLNFRNPASLSYLNATAFEVGLRAEYSSLESGDSKENIWSGNLSYVGLGFPMKNLESRILERDKSPIFWGMGFELQPYSLVGYDIATVEDHPQIDTINYTYQGSGGVYQIIWGNGVRYKRFSAGLNMGFVFGTISNDRTVGFPKIDEPYTDLFEDDSNVRGFIWNFGVQYHRVIRKNAAEDARDRDLPQLTIGAWGHGNNKVNIQNSRLTQRFNSAYSTSNEIAVDTIFTNTYADSLFSGKLPAEFGIGIMYQFLKRAKGKNSRYKIGIDFSTAAWSNFVNQVRPNEVLNDTWRFAIGAEKLPEASGYVKNYGNRIRYRAGLFYAKDPRVISGNNNSLTNYGITLGLGLPIIMKNETSFVNLALELGQLGGEDITLKNTYGRLTVGLTFNDNKWFYKRKFN